MKFAIVPFLVGALLTPTEPPPARVPVLVELFTSEGCSSCPLADELLRILIREQPVAGAEVIALGMHVDYWDALGWKDPASSHAATFRQQTYGSVFGSDRIYTPQMVVDGREEFVGSDGGAAKQAIEKALNRSHAQLTATASVQGDEIIVTVAIKGIPPEALKQPLEGVVAITEDDLTSVVRRGENGGRTLHHDAVVRHLISLGRLSDGMEVRRTLAIGTGWHRDRLNAVAFVQGAKTHQIWGAAATAIHESRGVGESGK